MTPKENKQTLDERFNQIIKNEPSLKFLNKLTQDLPELKLYLVGGMVRDIIANIDSAKDFDFIATGIPMKKLASALSKYGNVIGAGRNFGVLKFEATGSELDQPIDIALPRTEQAFGTGGYRDVTTQSDYSLPVEEDLGRRDLTINAIAFEVSSAKRKVQSKFQVKSLKSQADATIIDPFNGQDDLKKKIIRSVGNPKVRFQEDYSRLLRAIRFACKFDAKIESKTWDALKSLMPHINDKRKIKIVDILERKLFLENRQDKQKALQKQLREQIKKDPNETRLERVTPMETVSTELLKSLKLNPVKALELLDYSGALKQLLPEVLKMKDCPQPPNFHSEGDVWTHTMMMLDRIYSKEFKKLFPNEEITGEFVLGVLLHDVAKPLTIQTPEKDGTDRIRFNEHAEVGAKVVAEIARRFALSNEHTDKLTFMEKNHMIVMSVPNVSQIRQHKFAERFIDSPHSKELLMLFYLDSACTVPKNGKPDMTKFKDTLKRIKEIQLIRKNQPIKIIDGNQIMDVLGIKGGTLVGAVLEVIDELKDKGKVNNEKEALTFVKKNEKIIKSVGEKFIEESKDVIAENIIKKLLS